MTLPAHAYATPEEGAAFISGEQAALLIVVPQEDREHEREWWLGFLSGLRRRGSLAAHFRVGPGVVQLERDHGR